MEESPVDNIMRVIAFIFDLNFNITKKIIKESKYIDKLYERFVFDDELRTAMYNSKIPAMKKRMEILNLDKSILIPNFKN